MESTVATVLETLESLCVPAQLPECPQFATSASGPSLGFFLPGLPSLYAHFIELNNCAWALPELQTGPISYTLPPNFTDLHPAKSSCKEIALVARKKRGRKPLRPQDPIRKKTEQKDKYWFRTFRSYMRGNIYLLTQNMNTEDRVFWEVYLSLAGRPSKGSQFPSYSKEYKNYLFSHVTFSEHFVHWFRCQGESVLSQKYQRDSALWFVYYDYAARDLVNYKATHNL